MRTTDPHPSDQHCVFRVGDDVFAVAATDIREFVEAVPIVAVPQSPPCLVGLCHLRNEFVPVLSLSSLIAGASTDRSQMEFLLVIDSPEGAWALAISQATGLEKLELASTSGTHPDTQSRLVLGTASYRDTVVRVLDANRLYRAAADLLDHMWSPEIPNQDGSQDISTQLNATTAS